MESIEPRDALQHEELDFAPALAPFVTRRMRTWSDEPVTLELPLPPTGSLYLTRVYGDPLTLDFAPGERRQAPPVFIGGQLRRIMPVTRVQGHLGLTGFEFTPTGFYRLFGLDCQPLTDTATALTALAPDTGPALIATLEATPDPGEQMEQLQDFLLARVTNARPASVVDDAVALIEQEQGDVTVERTAEYCHLSERQLHRRFLREVGIGPKHFAKVIQIKEALATLHDGTPGQLRNLAQRTGYFDQAHFIHDFQRLVGTNPLAFLRAPDSFLRTYMKTRSD